MRFNDSPYPELETRSSPPPKTTMSPATTLRSMNSWHTPSPPDASELGIIPRMNSASELGSTRMGSHELDAGTEYVEMRGEGNGYAEIDGHGAQARPRYYGNGERGGSGNAGHVTGGVAQNF
jgi:hypothetical protein